MIDPLLLDRLDLFRGLAPAAARELAARASLFAAAPGQVLWRAGDPARGLFIVLEGQVRVVRARADRQHVIHTEGPGGTLGEVPLFGGGVYPATAVAVRRTRCLVLNRDAIAAALREDPELASRLLGRLAARVQHLIGRVDRLTGQTVTGRVAAFLLARASASGGGVVTLGGTQQELAEELGTVREVVVRALRELRTAGVIRGAGRGGFEILDPERLAALAAEREGSA